MKILLAAVVCLLASQAFALGPLPNGSYSGSMVCAGSNPACDSNDSMVLQLEETAMHWIGRDGDQPSVFAFQPDRFFTVTHGQDTGHGYYTEEGLHWDITIKGSPGEDTFYYAEGALHLTSSVTATIRDNAGRVIATFPCRCWGRFAKQP